MVSIICPSPYLVLLVGQALSPANLANAFLRLALRVPQQLHTLREGFQSLVDGHLPQV